MKDTLRIAARRSDLARLQAVHVAQLLQDAHPGLKVDFHFSESLGDRNQHDPLWKMPEKGVFTSDLSQGLHRDQWDLVVHSWKDLPIESDEGVLGAPPRADPCDVVLFARDRMDAWQDGGRLVVLSSSPRRAHNLGPALGSLLPRPPAAIDFVPVRGNIPTRIAKLLQGESGAQALVVAKAALDRLLDPPDASFAPVRDQLRAALARCRWLVAPLSLSPPAPAQGALALEARGDDARVKALVAPILCASTTDAVRRERARLAEQGGGCHQKLGVAVVPTRWGALHIERGLGRDGEIIHIRQWDAPAFVHAPGGAPWSSSLAGIRVHDRVPFPDAGVEVARLGHWYVSHPDAVPTELIPAHDIDPAIWCSGLMTWRRLVARGFWVQGCDDGMGESQPNFSSWFGQATTYRKLGHAGSPELGDGVATYRLVPSLPPDPQRDWRLAGRTHFYWKSSSQFDTVVAACPDVLQAFHACGPGHTARHMATRVSRLEICLDEQDWRDRHGFHCFA